MITHIVKKGETLWGIRKKYGLEAVPFKSIQRINPIIKSPSLIRPGWKIKLPSLKKFETTKRAFPYARRREAPSWKIRMWAARAARLKAEKEEIEKMEEPVRLKKMITKYYYLTPQFIQEIEKVPMRKGKPGEIEIRIKKTEKGPKIIGREKTTWYGKYYYPREGAKEFVSIIKSRPTTVFHELLHSHFFKKRYSSKTFNQIWERSKKEPGGEMLVWIDRRILRNYERIHRFPYSFAQERYAHFGAELGGYGKAAKRLEDIPPGLRFYYSDIILSRTKMPSIAKPTPFA